eukprot:15466410-Alexandrium_andersonii.AAC.1
MTSPALTPGTATRHAAPHSNCSKGAFFSTRSAAAIPQERCPLGKINVGREVPDAHENRKP